MTRNGVPLGRSLVVTVFKGFVGAVGGFVGGLAGFWGAAGAYEVLTPGGQFGYEFEGMHLAILASTAGAVVGWFGGVRAASASVRRGAHGFLLLATALALLIGGAGGAMAATDAWRDHHMIVKLKQTPYECRHDPPYPRYCRDEEPYVVRHPTKDIPALHAAAGGMAGAAAGALIVSTAGYAIIRGRPRAQ